MLLQSNSQEGFFSLQERRMSAAVLEMQRKMRLKDETLKQLRAVVFDSETDSEHQPHQQSKSAAVEAPLRQKSGSSSPPPVRFVDNTPDLLLKCFEPRTSYDSFLPV